MKRLARAVASLAITSVALGAAWAVLLGVALAGTVAELRDSERRYTLQ